jgi:hypothetical protein
MAALVEKHGKRAVAAALKRCKKKKPGPDPSAFPEELFVWAEIEVYRATASSRPPSVRAACARLVRERGGYRSQQIGANGGKQRVIDSVPTLKRIYYTGAKKLRAMSKENADGWHTFVSQRVEAIRSAQVVVQS